MYEGFWRSPEKWLEQASHRQEAVDYNVGNHRDFLRRHEQAAKLAAAGGRSGVNEIAPFLLRRVADARGLRCAWDDLRRYGGQTPGPNGHCYDDFGDSEVWRLLRAIGHAIRTDTYRPGPERELQIPKSSGRGYRTLAMRNIEDRVVERAIVRVIQPLLDLRFDDRSFGYRPGRDRCHALALARQLTFREGRKIWVTEDLKDAFDNVPLQRMLDLVRKYVPASDLVTLIERVIINDRGRGLRQGGPLSPLLTNVYLDHHLDRPWRRQQPEVPHIRVADDILLLCRSTEEAQTARAELTRLLTPAAMVIKQVEGGPVHDLHQLGAAPWLGFIVRARKKDLEIQISEGDWDQLDEHLALAHTKADAPLRAIATIQGWLSQLGPAYRFTDVDRATRRIAAIASEYAFDEIPAQKKLVDDWQRAHARWCKLKKANPIPRSQGTP